MSSHAPGFPATEAYFIRGCRIYHMSPWIPHNAITITSRQPRIRGGTPLPGRNESLDASCTNKGSKVKQPGGMTSYLTPRVRHGSKLAASLLELEANHLCPGMLRHLLLLQLSPGGIHDPIICGSDRSILAGSSEGEPQQLTGLRLHDTWCHRGVMAACYTGTRVKETYGSHMLTSPYSCALLLTLQAATRGRNVTIDHVDYVNHVHDSNLVAQNRGLLVN